MDVSVDDNFARFGAKSYAINKINSVEVRETKPNGLGGPILCGIIALFGVVGWFHSIGQPQESSSGGLIAAIVFSALAYWLWTKSKIRQYQLFLMTSSSETQALASQDSGYVYELRNQIEAAMLHHSRVGSDR